MISGGTKMKYVTEDGKTFTNFETAQKHEEEYMLKLKEKEKEEKAKAAEKEKRWKELQKAKDEYHAAEERYARLYAKWDEDYGCKLSFGDFFNF